MRRFALGMAFAWLALLASSPRIAHAEEFPPRERPRPPSATTPAPAKAAPLAPSASAAAPAPLPSAAPGSAVVAPPIAGDVDEVTAQARTEYARGNELAKREDWFEALAAFERSYALKQHPITKYNIATCLRVLGRYTVARAAFEQVLAPGSVEGLPPALASDARTLKQELDGLVAHVRVTVDPPETEIAIDGRPLTAAAPGQDGVPTAVAGIAASGKGETLSVRTFDLVVDPGAHILVLSRKGYRDIARTERFTPGGRSDLKLDLERLPATLRIRSNVDRPIVRVNDVDVGMAPVEVPRSAGTYRVVVAKEGYVSQEMMVRVAPGETPELDAKLATETVPLTKRWWFWAGAAVVVAGGVVATYALTRPDPEPPEYQRGNTGWLVTLGK